jgi:C-terminal processing protease CtpA/Prc
VASTAAAFAAPLALFTLGACGLGRPELAQEPPALLDLEEPLDRRDEPDDEDARRALAPGAFTGVTVRAAGASLDALSAEDGALEVAAVVENSPADFAGVEPGDLILEVRLGARAEVPRWPSAWRAIELSAEPGATIELVLDRAGREHTLRLTAAARARAAPREAAERFREEERAGVVLRTATEVEARAAGLGPGGGAVVVGLARASPWRRAGVVYGDVVASIDGARVEHPQVVLDTLRRAPAGSALALTLVRGAQTLALEVRVTARASELRSISIPFLYSWESDRGRSETSILFGLYRREATPAAWRVRLLWFVSFSGGDADRLVEDVPAPAAPAGDGR